MDIDIRKMIRVAQNWGNTNVGKQVQGGLFFTEEQLERLDEFTNFVTDEEGEFIIRSAKEVRDYRPEVISAFCVRYGIYGFPTLELVDFLKEYIDSERVLEIGAGRGILSKALSIRGTDSYQQRQQHVAELYEAFNQKPVQYGKHVERYDGVDAVRRYKPDIVLASWVTHMYNPKEHRRGGNNEGVKEEKILERVKTYIFIGNDKTHGPKPILDKPHETYKFPWLFSRRPEQELNSIWIWRGDKR